LIGETLKTKREALGLDLKQIAASLRIRYDYLQALEEDSFEKLPAEVYIKGYVREYALLLGIDPEPLIASYANYAKQQRVEPGEIQSEPSPPRKSRLSPLILFLGVGALILCAIYAGFFMKKATPVREHEIVQFPPLVPPQPTPEPAEVSGQPPGQKEASIAPDVNPKQYVLRVVATDVTWMRVELGGGKTEEVLLQPGDSREWTSPDGFGLKIGNAGGVRLTVNGKNMGIPGKKGEVLRLHIPEEKSSETGDSGD